MDTDADNSTDPCPPQSEQEHSKPDDVEMTDGDPQLIDPAVAKNLEEIIQKGITHAVMAKTGLCHSISPTNLVKALKNAESFLAEARSLLAPSVFDRLNDGENVCVGIPVG